MYWKSSVVILEVHGPSTATPDVHFLYAPGAQCNRQSRFRSGSYPALWGACFSYRVRQRRSCPGVSGSAYPHESSCQSSQVGDVSKKFGHDERTESSGGQIVARTGPFAEEIGRATMRKAQMRQYLRPGGSSKCGCWSNVDPGAGISKTLPKGVCANA